MTWIALLLIGIGTTDLVFSARPMRHVPEAVGATVLIVLGLLGDPGTWRDLVALLVLGAVVVAWGQTVTRGFASGRAGAPLVVLAAGLGLAVVASPLAGEADGILGAWLDRTPVPVLADLPADRALLLLGALLVQGSTGNVLVRLVLTATGTVSPARVHGREVPSYRLKGGRLLGPMERLFILGLGLAGELTAAAIVVAAKGLLRWPELQAARDEDVPGSGIHQVTEYFLVGSFVSWLIPLTSLVLMG
ncbi:hypothetical protein [Nocardioides coralli]|uniref:hypothetical protein n=1 Tax=Nocardioides coralli TaxID=2872154 RepID=UPI001CA405CC|nr:hypothetical protein [Nocardioides coralli]QZY30362.1 hypothetical protein K6T13_06810 [Nocardioides coralli]